MADNLEEDILITQYYSSVDEENNKHIESNRRRKYKAIEMIQSLKCKEVIVRDTIYRAREDAGRRLWGEYFSETANYPAYMFRRRFRMSRPLFNRILNVVCDYDDYFVEKVDGYGRPSFTRHQKNGSCFALSCIWCKC